ncbi:MAG: anti-sigma F factor [Clostridia bacterium]|nr:anti-sigma F factor [Clostridia bacterium]
MKFDNQMLLKFDSLSANEGFARSAVAAFCTQINPTLDEVTDIKTAVSEAVTNCVVHAYPNRIGEIEIWVGLSGRVVTIKVKDWGIGISDIERAREPFFTTKLNDERAGMGFTVMESFMDSVSVKCEKNQGVEVVMSKKLLGKKTAVCGG